MLLCIATDSVGNVIDGLGPSRAQIRALVARTVAPARNRPTIPRLLRADGQSLAFTAPSAGSALINWSASARNTSSKAHSHSVLIASAQRSFTAAGTVKVKLKLSRQGRSLLSRVNQLRPSAVGSFTPTGSTAVTATARYRISR